MSKMMRTLTQDWNELIPLLSDDLDASAKACGAMHRRRKITAAADLLRLILIYAIVLSLRRAAVWGVGLGLCDVSRQDLEQRVLNSTAWLRALLAELLPKLVPVPVTDKGLIGRVILRDASVIARPGSPGTEWRIHLSWCPFCLQPAQVTLTDEHTGEGLENAGLQANDLVLADRAHGIWRTIQVALDALAYFIIRLTWSNLPLHTLAGEAFDPVAWLQTWPETQATGEITVLVRDDPQRRPFRLVVGRLPADKAEAARDEVRRTARQEKRTVNPNTLCVAGFCLVLTNLPATAWPILAVLAFYRVRWQIEWCFRRWKSLCHLDALPAYPAPIAEPVLVAKLILILLMQHRLGAFPWTDLWAAADPPLVVSTLVTMAYTHLCETICPSAVFLQLIADPTPFLRHLRASRRKRSLQLADAARDFAKLLEGIIPLPALC